MSGVSELVELLSARKPEPPMVKKVSLSAYLDAIFADALEDMAKALSVPKSRLAGALIVEGVLEGLQTLRSLGYEGLPDLMRLENPSLPFEGGE